MCWPRPSAAASAELPDGFHFDCAPPDGRYLEVETHKPDNDVDKRLVAVCNASTRGPTFGKQIAELENRAGEIPVAIVRTTDFPKTGKAIDADCRHAETARAKRSSSTDADWRRMLAFEAFRARRTHSGRTSPRGRRLPGRSVNLTRCRKILKLSALAAIPRHAGRSHRRRLLRQSLTPFRPTSAASPVPALRRERRATRPRPHRQRDAGPGDFRAERVRPACGVPRRVGQR